MKALEPIFEDVIKPDQQRQVEVAALQAFHQFNQIQASATLSAWLHADMAAQIDGEVRISPTFQSIELGAVLNIPTSGWR